MLTERDRKYWEPVPGIVKQLCDQIPEGAKVLEIGPGHVPFPRANRFVDWEPKLPGTVKCDLGSEALPFPDKSFDFCYCRHVLEDMHNPFPLCAEMSRVAHAGYVETPSPIAEMARGIDGGSPPYRGYHHHRFIIWRKDAELCFVSKYPMVEYLSFDEERLDESLRSGPIPWNTYYLWSGQINVRHLQNPIDYYMPTDYGDVIKTAIEGA